MAFLAAMSSLQMALKSMMGISSTSRAVSDLILTVCPLGRLILLCTGSSNTVVVDDMTSFGSSQEDGVSALTKNE